MSYILKFTEGYVSQKFELRDGEYICVQQNFHCPTGEVTWEDENGEILTEIPQNCYCPFNMEQSQNDN
jgi:hypothetical protein